MKTKFVRCDFCKSEIQGEECKFAVYNTVVGSRQYVFCCEQCAQRFKQQKKEQTKKEEP